MTDKPTDSAEATDGRLPARDCSPSWFSMASAPKDGTEILLCMPGGQSDHYHVLGWMPVEELQREDDASDIPASTMAEITEDGGVWMSRYYEWFFITGWDIANCHLKPMWQPLTRCPSSLSYRENDQV